MSDKLSPLAKYRTPEEIQEKIDLYFSEKCGEIPVTDKNGEVVKDVRGIPVTKLHPPTISGLALHLGFTSRQSMYDYKKKPAFAYTIKEATLKIEDFAEQQLFTGQATGAIFWLKNKGWKDKSEVDVNANFTAFGKGHDELAEMEREARQKLLEK